MTDNLMPDVSVVRSEGGNECGLQYVRFDVINAGQQLVAYVALTPGNGAAWSVYTEWPAEETPDYVVKATDQDRSSAIDWAEELALGFLAEAK